MPTDPMTTIEAARIQTEINSVSNVSETRIIGGHKRQFIVHFDPASIARHRLIYRNDV